MTIAESAPVKGRATLGGHLAILRVDHWFKNVFVLPGVVVALSAVQGPLAWSELLVRFAFGLASVCLTASSNYVVNELLDAPFDRHHPTKHKRPVPAGLVHRELALFQWIALMLAGLLLGLQVGESFAITMAVLWVMGCIYNIPPVRSKDLPYLDVLSESVNNPLRMLAGWFIVAPAAVAPASLLLSYWMIGAYFMAMKRYAEYRAIGDHAVASAYRRSFEHYTETRLLTSIMFYGSASMLFFGAFIMRYRLELVLAFPLVALVMAAYLDLGMKSDSPVQRPEELYRQPRLMVAVGACAAAMLALLFVDIPALDAWLAPLMPPR